MKAALVALMTLASVAAYADGGLAIFSADRSKVYAVALEMVTMDKQTISVEKADAVAFSLQYSRWYKSRVFGVKDDVSISLLEEPESKTRVFVTAGLARRRRY